MHGVPAAPEGATPPGEKSWSGGRADLLHASLGRLSAIHPDHEMIEVFLAEVLFDLDRPADAAASFEALTRKYPENARAFQGLGIALLSLADPDVEAAEAAAAEARRLGWNGPAPAAVIPPADTGSTPTPTEPARGE